MKPYVHHVGNFFLFQWNLDCSVGNRGANRLPSDVSYIQWYYTLAAEFPLTPEDRRAIYRQVRVTGFCRGTEDDPLVAAIFAQQRAFSAPAHPVIDGQISVAQGSGKIRAAAFHILRLDARLANVPELVATVRYDSELPSAGGPGGTRSDSVHTCTRRAELVSRFISERTAIFPCQIDSRSTDSRD